MAHELRNGQGLIIQGVAVLLYARAWGANLAPSLAHFIHQKGLDFGPFGVGQMGRLPWRGV